MGKKERLHVSEFETIEKVIHRRSEVKLTEAVAKIAGFSYELVSPSDGEYGRLLPNGNWTGLLGLIQRNEADVVISTLSATEERSKDFLFTHPYTFAKISFMTRKHEYVPDIAGFLHPFDIQVWFMIFACVFTMPVILRCILSKKQSLLNLFMSTVRLLCRQPLNLHLQNSSECVLISFWVFGCTFLSYFISAVLLSVLTLPSRQGIRTIKDLSKGITDGKYYCKAFPGSYYPSLFIQSEDPSIQIIGQDLKRNGGVSDFVGFLEDYTDDRKPVFIGIRDRFMPYKNSYFISEDIFISTLPAITTRKDFCCQAGLDSAISRLWTTGISNKALSDEVFQTFLRDYYSKYAHVNGNVKSDSKLTVTMFLGPFLFMIAFHFLAFLIFLIELCLGYFIHS